MGRARKERGLGYRCCQSPFESHFCHSDATKCTSASFLMPPESHRPTQGPAQPPALFCYSTAEIWQLCTCPQQSRITPWGKKMQKTHPHGHPKLSGDLGGRVRPVVGAHLSCPAPDGRGWGHVEAAAAALQHPPLQGQPFSCAYICHFLLGFQPQSSPAHLCLLFPRFFLLSPLATPAHTHTGAAQGNDPSPNAALLSTVARRIANPTRCPQPYNHQTGNSRAEKCTPSSRSMTCRLASDKTMVI